METTIHYCYKGKIAYDILLMSRDFKETNYKNVEVYGYTAVEIEIMKLLNTMDWDMQKFNINNSSIHYKDKVLEINY